jgi:hypothetical protein
MRRPFISAPRRRRRSHRDDAKTMLQAADSDIYRLINPDDIDLFLKRALIESVMALTHAVLALSTDDR